MELLMITAFKDFFGMPDKKILIIREQFERALREAGVPKKAIERFLKETSTQLLRSIRGSKKGILTPDCAAQTWPADQLTGETPVEFVRRVYGHLIDNGQMTQADLAKIDKAALNALRNYCNYRRKDSDSRGQATFCPLVNTIRTKCDRRSES